MCRTGIVNLDHLSCRSISSQWISQWQRDTFSILFHEKIPSSQDFILQSFGSVIFKLCGTLGSRNFIYMMKSSNASIIFNAKYLKSFIFKKILVSVLIFLTYFGYASLLCSEPKSLKTTVTVFSPTPINFSSLMLRGFSSELNCCSFAYWGGPSCIHLKTSFI